MSTAAIVSMALLPVVAYIVWIARMGEHYPISPEDRALIWDLVGEGITFLLGITSFLLVGEFILNTLLGMNLWPVRLLIDSPALTWNWGPR